VALLIDSDLLVDLQRGDAASQSQLLSGDEDRAISVITVSELLHGETPSTSTGSQGSASSLPTADPSEQDGGAS
jgi:predicted nucleic acid-binding protein